jgi:glycolate oxidase FAD binding subunit
MDASLHGLAQRIRAAAEHGEALRLRGGGSKDFYGGALRGEVLDTRGHAGIVSYEPTELVVVARCGTSLAELEGVLAAKGQMLAFEPPHFGPACTLGGCVAAGLSGPRRASAGAVRDYVLGAKLVDGRGQVLAFGGQVMKNVAGYDVSRLLAGSMGTLGLISEVSLKVLPRPAAERTLRFEMPQERAIDALNRWAGQPLPISASAWCDGELRLRLAGAQAAVRSATQKLGGEPMAEAAAQAYWSGIREQTDGFFAGEAALWRLSVASVSPPIALPGVQLLEWGGGLRWLRSAVDAGTVRDAARRAKGHATLFRGGDKGPGVFSPLAPVIERLHRDLKRVFDPAGIFNPGRMYADL